MLSTVLLATAVICLGAQAPRPLGFVAAGLAVLTILSSVAHWPLR